MNISPEITNPEKRYDFLLVFDVTDGNPNGDPDAGNMPRLDPETMQGIVTDVCLKRKIRNFIELHHADNFDEVDQADGYGIFVRDSSIALNTKIKAAALAVGETVAEKKVKTTNDKGRAEMCRRYFDVRMFGGVLSTGEINCGQVRGPMQLTFSRSVDPIIASDVSITRVAITKEGENKETEMGRKSVVPYGLYVGKGFYSPSLGTGPRGTGVTKEDLEIFWQAVTNMFEHDHSAARGDMRLRQVYVFAHENKLGNAPSGRLFDTIQDQLKAKDPSKPIRAFSDYQEVQAPANLPNGVTLHCLLD
ncbi:MAG: type I-C CRISPR-associated protein Cas7/Csd2 [Armatimonadetes bacterium]|nr:type I-C CRISPR-associated protein Cas7/Csd2 [Armatimonadota bacterium]